MKLANESNILPSDDLSYLERLIDFEGGVDRGPMSGKKYLIYAPGKTGTVSIYTSILKQLSQENDYSDVLNMMLHNHNNASIVSIANGFESIGKAELLKKNIVRDIIELRKDKEARTSIISSFRDPLKRAISGTFQQLENLVARDSVSIDDICYDDIYKRLIKNIDGF